jgi:hypothetical protein
MLSNTRTAPARPHATMPPLTLRRKLLDELDDVDRSFKRARIHKYLQDVTIEPFPLSASDSGSGVSPISTISSISSMSSFVSDDESPSFVFSSSDIEEMSFIILQGKIDKLRHEIMTSRVLRRNPAIKKASQFHLLNYWRTGNLDQYRRRVRVDPTTFDAIVDKIRTHHIFHNNSNTPQTPVDIQLAIFLFRSGHYGNAASPEAIGLWAGVSPGTVVNCTNRVMVALLSLHHECVHLPTAEERESAKAWVTAQVCPEWSDGYLMVDGTKFALFQRPGLHGDAWFDKNRTYSLDCQVRRYLFFTVPQSDPSVARYPPRFTYRRGLCCWPYWQRPRLLRLPEHPHLQGTRAYFGSRRVDMGRFSISR